MVPPFIVILSLVLLVVAGPSGSSSAPGPYNQPGSDFEATALSDANEALVNLHRAAKRRRLASRTLPAPSSISALPLHRLTKSINMKRISRRAGRKLDLNLKSIEDNYQELCYIIVSC
jgi:hypothetical protein